MYVFESQLIASEFFGRFQNSLLSTKSSKQGARFFLTRYTKTGKNITKLPLNYQRAIKYNTWPYVIFNITIKYTNISTLSPSKVYSHWNFLFENIPSGNPASNLNLLFFYLTNLQRWVGLSGFLLISKPLARAQHKNNLFTRFFKPKKACALLPTYY
jgi:hypothetical protein